MVVILVISEEAVPFTRYIYHTNDQASPSPRTCIPYQHIRRAHTSVRSLHFMSEESSFEQ